MSRVWVSFLIAGVLLGGMVLIMLPGGVAADTPPYSVYVTRPDLGYWGGCGNPASANEIFPDSDGWYSNVYSAGVGNYLSEIHICIWDDGEYEFEYEHYAIGVGGYPNADLWFPDETVHETYHQIIDQPTGCATAEVENTGEFIREKTEGDYLFVEVNARANAGHPGCPSGSAKWTRTEIYLRDIEMRPPDDWWYNRCSDGAEAITTPVLLGMGETWSGYQALPGSDDVYVRFVYSDTNDNGSLMGAYMAANDAAISRRFYSDPYDGVEVYTHTVPNRTEPDGVTMGASDYDPTAAISGPTAHMTFTNNWNTVYLLSACVLDAPRVLTSSDYCTDGLEILPEPVVLDAVTGSWSDSVVFTASHAVVRSVVQNLSDERVPLNTVQNIEGEGWQIESAYWDIVTFTVPTTGTIAMRDSVMDVLAMNHGLGDMRLLSMCAVDATEYATKKRDSECHLINPDFVTDPTPEWSTEPTYTWDVSEENGGVILEDGGAVYQLPATDRGATWAVQVRARGTASDTLWFGSATSSLVAGGPQIYSTTLNASYQVYERDVFIEDGATVQVTGDDAIVDYVCLASPQGIIPMQDCDMPEWSPPSGTWDAYFVYVFEHLWALIIWLVCVIRNVIALGLNQIYNVIVDLILRVPMFPDADDGLVSWVEWVAAVIQRWLGWIGYNLDALVAWFPDNGTLLGNWLNAWWVEFVNWIADQFQVSPYWIIDQFDLIWFEFELFVIEIQSEIDSEFGSLILLLRNVANVFIVLLSGFRGAVSGETVAYIGSDFDGIGAYIWVGVDFINEQMSNTPIAALNIVALGVIAIGLGSWTIKKFSGMLQSLW